MKWLSQLWEQLRSSLWFVPTFIVVIAVLLAIALIEAESLVAREQLTTRWPRLFGTGAEGARGMLEAIAGSMITVAGVAFSITVVTFTLASSQYTSRVLRNFMRDRANQAVLGVFLGVFAYCLVVLRTIRGGDDNAYVPTVAVLAAVLLALVAIGFLVFFIHHIAASIQASNIIQAAATETMGAIDRQFPTPETEAQPSGPEEEPGDVTWSVVPARMTGYIQAIDVERFDQLAAELGTMIRLEHGLGDFVVESTPLALLAGRDGDGTLHRKVNAACTVGPYRTVQQDAAFGIRQIVDIALKALSPGINDTTTGIICLDYLGAILVRLAPRDLGTSGSRGREAARVLIPRPTFGGLLREALDQIRQNAEGNVAVLVRLLQTLELVAGHTRNPARCRELLEQAALVMEISERSVASERDRASIRAAFEKFLARSDAERLNSVQVGRSGSHPGEISHGPPA